MWGLFWTHFINEEAGYTERLGNLSKVGQLADGEVGIQTQQSDFKSHAISISAKDAWGTSETSSPFCDEGNSGCLHMVRTSLLSHSFLRPLHRFCSLCGNGVGSSWGLCYCLEMVLHLCSCNFSSFPLNTVFVCRFLWRLAPSMLSPTYLPLIVKECLSLGLFTWPCGSVCSHRALHALSVFLASISILSHIRLWKEPHFSAFARQKHFDIGIFS